MKKLTLKHSRGTTKVRIESDYSRFRELFDTVSTGRKVCLLSDGETSFVSAEIKSALDGYAVFETSSGKGESVKSAENFYSVCEFLFKNGFTRKDALVAIGGGAVSDLVGFVASAYARGMNYVNCPTTLLSATDACIGGKTAVDFCGVKNALGEFYAPSAVYVAVNVLKSLPEKEIKSGMGEVAKYALISKKITTEDLIGGVNERLVYKCLSVKKKFVEKDEFDNGTRKILNLGHTYGHAVESAGGFKIPHGECVAAGLYAAINASAKFYNLTDKTVNGMKTILCAAGFGADYDTTFPARGLSFDKKSDGENIDLILLKKRGKPTIVKTPLKTASELFGCR